MENRHGIHYNMLMSKRNQQSNKIWRWLKCIMMMIKQKANMSSMSICFEKFWFRFHIIKKNHFSFSFWLGCVALYNLLLCRIHVSVHIHVDSISRERVCALISPKCYAYISISTKRTATTVAARETYRPNTSDFWCKPNDSSSLATYDTRRSCSSCVCCWRFCCACISFWYSRNKNIIVRRMNWMILAKPRYTV